MAWWLMLAGCGTGGVLEPAKTPTPAAPEPSGPVESLGGVVQGAPFDPSGFACEPGRCAKPAEIAGVAGSLIVWTCGDRAHRLGFRQDFLLPEAVADQLDRPSQAEAGAWGTAIEQATTAAGFTITPLAGEELDIFRNNLVPDLNVLGEPFPPPLAFRMTHPDGRTREMLMKQMRADEAATRIDPIAWKMEITLSTVSLAPCLAGI